jgi:hypothetical protein
MLELERAVAAIPTWDFWLAELFIAITFLLQMSKGVSRLHSSFGKKWVAVSFCVFSYLACMGIAVGHSYVSSYVDHLVQSLKSPPDIAQVPKGWGENFTKEKRTEYSQMLARQAFLDGGKLRDYIDLNGSLREYEPCEADHQYRVSLKHSIERLEHASKQFFYAAIAWLLIPLFGAGVGYLRWLERINLSVGKVKQFIGQRLAIYRGR